MKMMSISDLPRASGDQTICCGFPASFLPCKTEITSWTLILWELRMIRSKPVISQVNRSTYKKAKFRKFLGFSGRPYKYTRPFGFHLISKEPTAGKHVTGRLGFYPAKTLNCFKKKAPTTYLL